MSTILVMISSIQPPEYPLTMPRVVPVMKPLSSAIAATTSDMRAPNSIRENTSRPV